MYSLCLYHIAIVLLFLIIKVIHLLSKRVRRYCKKYANHESIKSRIEYLRVLSFKEQVNFLFNKDIDRVESIPAYSDYKQGVLLYLGLSLAMQNSRYHFMKSRNLTYIEAFYKIPLYVGLIALGSIFTYSGYFLFLLVLFPVLLVRIFILGSISRKEFVDHLIPYYYRNQMILMIESMLASAGMLRYNYFEYPIESENYVIESIIMEDKGYPLFFDLEESVLSEDVYDSMVRNRKT